MHTPRRLSKGVKNLAIAVRSQVHKGLDCQHHLFRPRAGIQYIPCESEVTIAPYDEYQAQSPGQAINADPKLCKPGNLVLSRYHPCSFILHSSLLLCYPLLPFVTIMLRRSLLLISRDDGPLGRPIKLEELEELAGAGGAMHQTCLTLSS